MSVYLYNMAFSLLGTDYGVGRFVPYNGSILNPTINSLSCAWFTYIPGGTPGNLGDYYAAVNTALSPSQWGTPQGDLGSMQLSPGDYLMVRLYSLDPNAQNYQTRFTGVFGRGMGQTMPTGASELQSPLVMSTPTVASVFPRAVIDADASIGASWPGALSDGSWVNWLGMVHGAPGGAANDYTFNIGASVYVKANPPSTGNLFTFGHDPRMHVGGSMKKREGFAA